MKTWMQRHRQHDRCRKLANRFCSVCINAPALLQLEGGVTATRPQSGLWIQNPNIYWNLFHSALYHFPVRAFHPLACMQDGRGARATCMRGGGGCLWLEAQGCF